MTYRKIGILGGMGPAAGVHFARLLIELNPAANGDAGHAPFILGSNPCVPSRVDAFLCNGTSPAPAIADELQALHAQGADFGVVICNTAHIYFHDIASRTRLPLINMVENTVSHVFTQRDDSTAIGLLATTATVKSHLYARAVEARGGRIVVPDDPDQAALSAAIFDPRYGIKATRNSPSDKAVRAIAAVASRMRESAGIHRLLLGCTELSLAIQTEVWQGFRVIDPVRILAATCLARAGVPSVGATASRAGAHA